jgi:hypothetical protein
MNTGRDQRSCSGSRPAMDVWPMDDGQCWLTPCVGINHLFTSSFASSCKVCMRPHRARAEPTYGAGRASVAYTGSRGPKCKSMIILANFYG